MITKLSELVERAETGPMQFGDDWPGVFIRGDQALYLAHILKMHLHHPEADSMITRSVLEGLASTLGSCDYRLHQDRMDSPA